MEQINCYGFVDLGVQLATCFASARMPLNQWNNNVQAAIASLNTLLSADARVAVPTAEPPARGFLSILEQISLAHAADGEAVLSDLEVFNFNGALFRLLNALQLELPTAPTFFVSAKGVFDSRRLITEASSVFNDYRAVVPPQAIFDIDQAGRCLAFDLPTAAGFHLVRATEVMIQLYMTRHKCQATSPSWGGYIAALKKTPADKRVVHHLDQLRELHRNPVAHPEVTLTMTEASSLWAMCTSAIESMLADMGGVVTGIRLP